MPSIDIEIPAPVIEAEEDYSASDYDVDTFVIDVKVGGVVVMTRTYSRKAEYRSAEYVFDLEGAKEKALAAFGQHLRRLIGEC